MHHDVVIVGAGHGGAAVSVQLRQRGFTGSIALVGRERELPYERPPLSKDYLLGKKSFDRLLIRPADYWDRQDIALISGAEVMVVDAAAQSVSLADGRTIGYGNLVWAAGGDPRSLDCPGATLDGIHTIRDRAHVDAILADLPDAGHVAIVGGGYIGLEAAAALRTLGKTVTVIEALPRVLARVAGAEISAFFESEHRAQGVDLRTGVGVVAFEGHDRVTGIRLTDESVVGAGLVIVGVGIVPHVAPLIAAGAEGGNGVLVDSVCRTTLPNVYALGDCAAQANPFANGTVVRIESVQNANDQAACVARAIIGQPVAYAAVPWFWSNQYDLRLQTVGLSAMHDVSVLRGDPSSRSFSSIYLREGRVIALDCVNNVRDYAQGRALVERAAAISPQVLADTAIPLKEMVTAG